MISASPDALSSAAYTEWLSVGVASANAIAVASVLLFPISISPFMFQKAR
jgi:hypothetical protein